ncbi:putative RNA-directed DNA polymerase [Helianthus anomalus]
MDGDPRIDGSRSITKFFISNLPEGCTPWELKCGIAGCGEVSDTYVAKKRDKEGNRFGFASFKDVKDKTELLKLLRGVRLGGCKLKVNIARFALENGSGNGFHGGSNSRFNPARGRDDVKSNNFYPDDKIRASTFRDFRSYRDVLGKGKEKEAGPLNGVFQDSGKQVVAPDRTGAMQDLIGVAVVGRTVDLETLVDLDRLLRIAKVSYGKIQYLGGLSVLISFREEPASRLFLKSKDLWGPWFSKLSVWEGQSLPFEKVAWLRVIGLPLHLLDRDIIKLVGEPFGKILHVQNDFGDAKDLSFVRIGVLSGVVERIKEVVSLKWKERIYRIMVEEELDVWIPDCLGRMSEGSSAMSSSLASSPVVKVTEPEVGGGFFGEDEVAGEDSGSAKGGACAGDSSKGGGNNNLSSKVQFNWQSFMGDSKGECSIVHGEGKKGVIFFKAGNKSKRRRKGGARNLSGSFMDSPNSNPESCERGRPTKRNRAQLDEESDPFSIDRILAQMNNPSDNSSDPLSSSSCVPSVNLNIPLNSDGVPIGGVPRESFVFPSSLPEVDQGGAGGSGSVEEGGEAVGDSIDHQVRATIKMGVSVGMELGNCENLVRNVILGKGINEVSETKCRNLDDKFSVKLWGDKNVGSERVDSSGLSGGLISLWDPNVFEHSDSIKDRNFIISRGKIKGSGRRINIANIYAPQDIQAKRILWDRLREVIENSTGMWILLGDFNAVRSQDERLKTRFNSLCAGNFNSFIYEAGLLEYDMRDRKFTRWGDNGRKGSKIDRMLVCSEFFSLWPSACFRALPRYLSDHSPIVLITKESNFGPKPFRIFNSWIGREGFEKTVREAALSFVSDGPADLSLLKKFEFLRARIKVWRNEMIKKEGEKESLARSEIEELEVILEERELDEEEEWVLSENAKLIKEIEINKTKDLRQRSRVKWAIDGDENSSFFHSMINCRKAKNTIHGLSIDGSWCSKPAKIKKHVFEFFRGRFKEELAVRPSVYLDNLKTFSQVDADSLVAVFSKEEIKVAVWDCGSNRAPGPDGFNFHFIKHFWDIFEDDFKQVLDEFHSNRSVSRGCASAFITLIPKVRDPSNLGEYRPISLVGAINKVVSKVLANRLKKVLGSVISDNQSAFLSGKFILDGPLIINEAISWLKKSKKSAFLFKLDFEKAYDNVNWGFVISIMNQMGFPRLWCDWVFGLLSAARAAVLVNGSPTFDFQCLKGMRQGDPLSPFLFLIVMEALSCCFNKATDSGCFEGIRLPNNGPFLSHLLFADDALVIGEWSVESISNVIRILHGFHICSGLRINLHKSSIMGVGVSDSEVLSLATSCGCKAKSFPVKYLGIPVGANMNRLSNWAAVIETFESRLSLWKAAVLSIGGRVTLIKSVL